MKAFEFSLSQPAQLRSSQSAKSVCEQDSEAVFVCSNKKCSHNAFICAKTSCNCSLTHLTCPQILITSIKRNIQAKIVPLQKTKQSILSQIQKTIDQLSDFKQKLTTQMESTLHLIGLTQNDQNLFNHLNSSHQNQQILTGQKLFELFNSTMLAEQPQSKNDVFLNEFSKIWESIDKHIKTKTQKIVQILSDFSKNKLVAFSQFFKESKIIESQQAKQKMDKFFNSTIDSTKLLYQALSKQYSIDEFHRTCDDIPHTLTICQTQYGKIIGGYTPLTWSRLSGSEYLKDESGKSFVFSLSSNDKFSLGKGMTAIYRCSPHGPLFGDGNSDFGISAPGSDSWSLIGRSYKNPNYPQGEQGYFHFNGNPGKSYYFGVKKWEVWQINFRG